MAEPDERAVLRLRHTARALGLQWPDEAPLAELERSLDPADPRQATFMLAIQRAGQGASYVPFREGERPWHSAIAATYAHATAPLRRLADRYVVQAALAVVNGRPAPAADAFGKLPPVMARADALGSRIHRAAIDLAEAVLLEGREGESFGAVATEVDDRAVRIQLCDQPVVARLSAAGVSAGDRLEVRLVDADPESRTVEFEVGGTTR
jgi:exoribonuclease R